MRFRRRFDSTAVARFDLGGTLGQVLPPIQLPYIAVQQAQPVPVDYASIKEKYRAQSEDALAKALKSTNDLWDESVKNLSLAPVYKTMLNERRQALQQDLYQKAVSNPGYFSSQANLLEVTNRMQNLIGSADIEAWKRKTKQFEEFDQKIKADPTRNLENDYWRDEHGQVHYDPVSHEKLTNRKFVDMALGATNLDLTDAENPHRNFLRELLGVSTNRPAGTLAPSAWTGNLADATKELDGWGELAHASNWKKGRGGWQVENLSSEQKARFGTAYDGLGKYQVTQGGESNLSAIATIQKALLSGGWRKTLSQPAVQGLVSQFDRAYDENSFGEHFAHTPLFDKSGEAISHDLSIEQVLLKARRGELKDGKEILEQVEKQRGRYIDSRVHRLIAERIGVRGYADQSDEQTTDLNLIKAGATAGGAGNTSYDQDIRDGYGNRQAVVIPQADLQSGPASVTQLNITPDPDALARRQAMYQDPNKPAPSVWAISGAGSNHVYLPASANQSVLESFGIPGVSNDNLSTQAILQKMKVQGYYGDAKVPQLTAGPLADLNRQYNKLNADLQAATTKLNQPGFNKTRTEQQVKDLTWQLQTVNQSLQQQADADNSPVRHRVNVVLPYSEFMNLQNRFGARDEQGQLTKAFHSRFDWEALPSSLPTTDLENGRRQDSHNINNVSIFDPKNVDLKERTRLGFSPTEKLVQFEMQIQRPVQDANQGNPKSTAGWQGQQMQAQRRGEVQRNLLNATQPLAQ